SWPWNSWASFMFALLPEPLPRFLLVQDRPVPGVIPLVHTGGTAYEVNQVTAPVDRDDLWSIAWLDYSGVFVTSGQSLRLAVDPAVLRVANLKSRGHRNHEHGHEPPCYS